MNTEKDDEIVPILGFVLNNEKIGKVYNIFKYNTLRKANRKVIESQPWGLLK